MVGYYEHWALEFIKFEGLSDKLNDFSASCSTQLVMHSAQNNQVLVLAFLTRIYIIPRSVYLSEPII